VVDKFRLMASMSDIGDSDDIDYKKRMSESFQSKVNHKFDQSTSTTIIQEEYPYGSGVFRDLLCRVTSVRTVGTGTKMSDSYKSIIFKDQNHPKNVGFLYKFEDNYWIANNSDIMSSPTDAVIVRRCNNMLRWKDKFGKIQSVPISFEEDAFYLTNTTQQEVGRMNGYRRAIVQRTELTRTLEPNQRFIFGDQCLKISGSGIGAFLNQVTEDDNSPAVIRLTMEYDYINPATDDLVNKIANAYSNNHTIVIDQKNTEYAVSANAYVFSATTFNNEVPDNQDVVWSVVTDKTYSMSQANNKLNIIFNDVGVYTINVEAKNNSALKTSIVINTVLLDKYNIQCEPTLDVITKGDTKIFTFDLYKNGVKLTDAIFNFEKIDTLSLDYYSYNIVDNKLSITNKRMTNVKVEIKCTSTNYTDSLPYNFNIRLGGAW